MQSDFSYQERSRIDESIIKVNALISSSNSFTKKVTNNVKLETKWTRLKLEHKNESYQAGLGIYKPLGKCTRFG